MNWNFFSSKPTKGRKQQVQEKRHLLLFKILLVVLSTVAVVYFMPRDAQFNYTYDIDKPWRYGQLIATFKFPIYKNDSVMQREQDSVMRRFQPYYTVDSSVKSGMIKKLQAASNRWKGTGATFYVRHIVAMLDTVYRYGMLSAEEYGDLKERGHSSIRLIGDDNTAVSVPVKKLFSTRSAYEYIMNKDTVMYPRSVMQQFDIIELLQPNLNLDAAKSKIEEEALKASVSGARGIVQSGQKIIDRGEIVTKEVYDILRSFERESTKHKSATEHFPYKLLGQTVFVLLVMSILVTYLSLFRADYLTNGRSAILLYALIVVFSIMASLMVSRNLLNVFMLPCCMVPIIIRVFMDSRTAYMFHCAMTIIISLVLRYPYEFIIMQLTAGMVAIQNLRELSQRSQIIRAAAVIVVSYMIFYTAYELIMENDLMKVDDSMYIFFIINGVLLLFTYPLLWLFEKSFRFVSDVTLVELSNINNPLLQRMTEVAPGTFQHSMQVANLASEVAKKIGARAQLVRTGALYHDIGKMERPVFFTENQAGGNPHKHLTAIKSAEVIMAHITNGLLLADKHHLPEIIKRFISTHHGLGKTKYFYITYKNEHPDEEVDEKLFTYPGPNPGTKEEAILMMADSVEAASRSLKEYTEESISGLVDKVIDSQVAEGYFNECDITFKEIAVAKSVFKEKLKIVYHTRISYPELNVK
ncbi:MAG: HDIG domain-containing protein [Bacteroides sp.]|nr:HDIG domain-containing protein [Roseburia sp.]MCM1345920.1 HDIG domain-containing protein [Bacteroides sp.]MCM1420085.1 HDIG domain-containing protein [Bacteroides sp.]